MMVICLVIMEEDGLIYKISNGLINSVASIGNSIGFEQAGNRLSWTFGSAGNGQAVTELVDLQGRVAAAQGMERVPQRQPHRMAAARWPGLRYLPGPYQPAGRDTD